VAITADYICSTAAVSYQLLGHGAGNCFRFLCARVRVAETGGWVPREPRGPTSLDDLGDEELPAAVASRALGTAAAAPVGEESWVAETCVAALELWLGSFVRELRAASLRFLPSGGLYLAGGVSTKLMPRLGEVRTDYTTQDTAMHNAARHRPYIPLVFIAHVSKWHKAIQSQPVCIRSAFGIVHDLNL
jgi:glucokinase